MDRGPSNTGKERTESNDGMLAMFVLTFKLLWRYAKKLFTVDTLANLEKRQGSGSGMRDIEDDLLDAALQSNPHHIHLTHSLNEVEIERGLNLRADKANYEIVIKGERSEPRS